MSNNIYFIVFSLIISCTLSQETKGNIHQWKHILQKQYLGTWKCQSVNQICLHLLPSSFGDAILKFNDQEFDIILQYNRSSLGQKLNLGHTTMQGDQININQYDLIGFLDQGNLRSEYIQNITISVEFKDDIFDLEHMEIIIKQIIQEQSLALIITIKEEKSATPQIIFSCVFIVLILVSCFGIMAFLVNLNINLTKVISIIKFKISFGAYFFALFQNYSIKTYYYLAIQLQVGWYSITLIILENVQIGLLLGVMYFVIKMRFQNFNFCYFLISLSIYPLNCNSCNNFNPYSHGILYLLFKLLDFVIIFILFTFALLDFTQYTCPESRIFQILLFISLNVFANKYCNLILLIQLYFRGCPSNVIAMKSNYIFTAGFFLINLFCIIILYLQHKFGPQFYKNQIKKPLYYQFFQQVSISDQEECCPICLQALIRDPKDQDDNNIHIQTSLLKTLMVPPCNHKFHIPCMKSWIEVQKLCPVCRAPIPM